MSTIYEPKGKAREYSPLAVNIYKGCDNGCFYCYVPTMMKVFNSGYQHNQVETKENFLSKLSKDAIKLKGTQKQVLLSFTGDPYCEKENIENQTTEVLKILLQNQIPTAILTKGGTNTLKDLEIIKQFGKSIKIGATLTADNSKDSIEWENKAHIPEDRLKALQILKKNNITTWASMEPVIDPDQTINLIKSSHNYIDHYKIGKLNHHINNIDWEAFLYEVVDLCRGLNKHFYIKNDLAEYNKKIKFTKEERDQDFLNIKPF